MGSRVHNIKKKFEGLSEASKEQNKTDKNIKHSTNFRPPNLELQPRKKLELGSNLTCTAGTKSIIKRSHAFRSDRCNRNPYDDLKLTSKTESIRNITEVNNCGNQNKSQSFISKMLISQDLPDNMKTFKTNSKVNSDNLSEILNYTSSHTKTDQFDHNENKKDIPEYSVSSKVNKPKGIQSSSLSIIEPGSKPINNNRSRNGNQTHINPGKEKDAHNILKSNPENVCITNNIRPNFTGVKTMAGGYEDIHLSNTLKKVLNSPLPTGPPPKKPPRTFVHGTELTNESPNNCKMSVKCEGGLSSDDINVLTAKGDTNQLTIIKPIRSKTESQIMLKKLEIALFNHKKHGKILEPKVQEATQPKPNSNSADSKYEKLTCVSSDNKQSLSNGCFGVLSCSNVRELNNSSHVYDIPSEYKLKINTKECRDGPSLSDMKLKENCSVDHIYEKPHITNKFNSFNSKLKSTSSGSSVHNTNSIDHCPSLLNHDKAVMTPALHYMSSPVLEKESLKAFQAASPDIITSTQTSIIENNGTTRSCPGRSSSLDWDITKHRGSNRNLSIDFHKDFEIDNEKIQMMVNEVYSKCLAMPQDSDSESMVSTPEEGTFKPLPGQKQVSPEEVQKERQQRTAERKSYLKRVCSRAKSIVRSSVDYPHLFEYLLLIGLDLNPARCKVPYIKKKYPADAKIPRGIEQLCFPDASDWPPQACADESGSYYCIIITNENGIRKYGYCRRVQPEGAPICLPLAYCIVSPYKANYYFSQVLAELESRHGQPEQILSSFIHQLYENPFPAPGQGLHVINSITDEKMEILIRKLDPRQEETDIARLLSLVRFSVFLQLFSTLLLERKVILLSYSISKLSTCIEGLCAALYPFHWQHTLVPIVPSCMLDLCHAPTPYLIGLLKPCNTSTHQSQVFNSIEQVLIVDVDESRIVQSCGDESTVLPPRLCRGLKEALQCAVADKHTALSPSHNLVAAEALMALFVQLVGHYHNHIFSPSSTDERKFQRDAFVKSVSSNTVQNFLDWFSETTMFTAFIESRLDRSFESWGLFEQRCVEYFAQQQAPTTKSYRANINKTVKSFGDRLKEWANSQ